MLIILETLITCAMMTSKWLKYIITGDPFYMLNHEFLSEVELLASTTFEDLKAIYDRVKQKDV